MKITDYNFYCVSKKNKSTKEDYKIGDKILTHKDSGSLSYKVCQSKAYNYPDDKCVIAYIKRNIIQMIYTLKEAERIVKLSEL
jgi:hypothetical protein